MKAKTIESKVYSTVEACARPYLPLKLFGLNNPIQCTLCIIDCISESFRGLAMAA